MENSGIREAVRANTIKSAAIVIAFPFVLPIILFLGILTIAACFGRPDAVSVAGRIFYVSLLAMIAVNVVWLPIGYFINQWLVDQSTGARLVSRSELPRVWSLLDRLSQRCGIPTPSLRLIDTDARNAYASGLTASTYCVTVTRGLLEALEDDELEGVLAHELTHIRHQDVRLMVIAGVLVGTIPMLHDLAMKAFWAVVMGLLNIYRTMFTLLPMPGAKLLAELSYGGLYWTGRGAAYVVGLVATLCSLMLHFALSRERELLADAGAAELTGNPGALISALRKISGNSTLDTTLTAVRAMCIENAVPWFGLFSTHPSIEDRTTALARLASAPRHSTAMETGSPAAPTEVRNGPSQAAPDAAAVLRYRALLERGAPAELDVIEREHLYRRARETIERARARNPAITEAQLALARANLEAAIEALETNLNARDLIVSPPRLTERA